MLTRHTTARAWALRRYLAPVSARWLWIVLAIVMFSGIADARPRGKHHQGHRRHHVHGIKKMVHENTATDIVCNHRQVGLASWYAPGGYCLGCPHGGTRTANGERFTGQDLTAAHRTLPFNTMVKVCQGDGSRCIIARINDRGPFVEGRIIDLSLRAATDLGIMGVEPVELCWE
jgi:rare lipoprotein A (peptidoglycan hydrolase)